MKKILIHSLVFSPDGVSTAYLYNDIALGFQDRGYEVVVITSTPHFNPILNLMHKQRLKPHCHGLFYQSDYYGIRVVHIPQEKYSQTWMRLIGFVYWHIMAFFLAMRESNIDVILSPSPPITIGLVNILLGKLKNARTIYNVQEIYPDFLIEQRNLRNQFVVKVLKWIEKTVYNRSDAVITIDKMFYNTIVDRFYDKSSLSIIPNFVNTDIYNPFHNSDIPLNRQYFRDNDSLKVVYAGNIGHAQDWELLISVSKMLKGYNIDFYIVGEGVKKAQLMNEVMSQELENIYLVPYQPRSAMPALIGFSDIQFIFMSPDTDRHGFPSKVYTIMACRTPLLISSSQDTPIVKFLQGEDCAFIVTNNDMDVRANAIAQFLVSSNKIHLSHMGENGIGLVRSHYSHHVVPGRYVDLADKILES
jgi:colanic acid biosynthesis glycosyl transferase WcaI